MTPHDHQGHTPRVGPTHLEPDLSTEHRPLVLVLHGHAQRRRHAHTASASRSRDGPLKERQPDASDLRLVAVGRSASGRPSHLPQSRRLTRSAPIPTQTLPRCSRRRVRSPLRTKDTTATTPPTAAPQAKPAPNSLAGAARSTKTKTARTTPTKNSTSRTT